LQIILYGGVIGPHFKEKNIGCGHLRTQ